MEPRQNYTAIACAGFPIPSVQQSCFIYPSVLFTEGARFVRQMPKRRPIPISLAWLIKLSRKMKLLLGRVLEQTEETDSSNYSLMHAVLKILHEDATDL